MDKARRFSLMLMVALAATLAWAMPGFAEERFPAPEFETAYQLPAPEHPHPRQDLFEYLDVGVLLLALGLAAWLALKKRSRTGLYLLTLFTLLYFGFYRKGCICPIGSVQNVTLSFFGDYVIPLGVILFFSLPLLFALFFGRVFCASVCPLGAAQEVVIYKPLKLPLPIKHVLSLIPYIYLGLAVLYTATGSGFIICRFDPFVGFFRLTATSGMLLLGLVFLLVGIFIARPYCRWFCPYGLLLGMFSTFSKKHLAITPTDCVQCRLCENSCPIDAIRAPSPKHYKTNKQTQIRNFGIWLACAPLIILASGYGFSQLSDVLARQDRTVQLAEQMHQEETGALPGSTLDSDAFRQEQTPLPDLYARAARVRQQFKLGSWLIGLFLGLVICVKVFVLLQRRRQEDYEPDRFHCVSCGRCMEYCPVPADGSVKKS